MKAIVFEEFGEPPAVRDVPVPEPHPDAVVVRVEMTGLCRSDWHAWSGHDPDVSPPHVPGHEFVGRVSAVGSEVRGHAAGDRVITPFVCGCGTCEECLNGNAQVCARQTQPGFTHWGSYAEFVEVRHADFNAIAVGEDLDARDLVGLGCRFATAFRGLHGRARVQPGETVAVFGCGGVGLSAVMIARSLGAEAIAIDIDDEALRIAIRNGAGSALNSRGLSPEEVAEEIRDRAGRPAVTVDALGVPAIIRAALLALRPGGRHVQIGLFPEDPPLPVGRIIAQEISFLGSHGMAAADYPEMLALVERGALRPSELVTRQIALEAAAAALVEMSERTVPGMTVIVP